MKILLLGNQGQLGWELERTLATAGILIAVDYPEIDLAHPESIRPLIQSTKPEIIINATAYTAVDRAESEAEIAYAINGITPGVLAETALEVGALLIHFSTDYVFDGKKGSAYIESDIPNPLGVYGASKLAGEQAIQQVGGQYLILRTSWVYSLRRPSFVTKVLEWSRQQPVSAGSCRPGRQPNLGAHARRVDRPDHSYIQPGCPRVDESQVGVVPPGRRWQRQPIRVGAGDPCPRSASLGAGYPPCSSLP